MQLDWKIKRIFFLCMFKQHKILSRSQGSLLTWTLHLLLPYLTSLSTSNLIRCHCHPCSWEFHSNFDIVQWSLRFPGTLQQPASSRDWVPWVWSPQCSSNRRLSSRFQMSFPSLRWSSWLLWDLFFPDTSSSVQWQGMQQTWSVGDTESVAVCHLYPWLSE